MDDAIAVALEIVAIGMWRLRKAASAGVFNAYRVVGEHEESLAVRRVLYAETQSTPRKSLANL
jgi:hypothetical protein